MGFFDGLLKGLKGIGTAAAEGAVTGAIGGITGGTSTVGGGPIITAPPVNYAEALNDLTQIMHQVVDLVVQGKANALSIKSLGDNFAKLVSMLEGVTAKAEEFEAFVRGLDGRLAKLQETNAALQHAITTAVAPAEPQVIQAPIDDAVVQDIRKQALDPVKNRFAEQFGTGKSFETIFGEKAA